MPKFDPALLPALPKVRESKTFTDKRHPGHEFEFTFSVQEGGAADMFAPDLERRLVARYVDGDDFVIAPNEGGTIPIEETLCGAIARLMQAESPDDHADKWSFAKWVVFAHRCPDAFSDVCRWYGSLHKQLRKLVDPEGAAREEAREAREAQREARRLARRQSQVGAEGEDLADLEEDGLDEGGEDEDAERSGAPKNAFAAHEGQPSAP